MKKEKEATNLKEKIKENIDDVIKYLIELYEFQEKIKVTYRIKEADQK